jgi:hypothetical protein
MNSELKAAILAAVHALAIQRPVFGRSKIELGSTTELKSLLTQPSSLDPRPTYRCV